MITIFFCIAENAAKLHSGRVKELSAELKQEKSRHSQLESTLQSKMAKAVTDYENMKQVVESYKMERQKTKENERLQALQQENQDLTRRINLLLAGREGERGREGGRERERERGGGTQVMLVLQLYNVHTAIHDVSEHSFISSVWCISLTIIIAIMPVMMGAGYTICL